MKRGEEDKIRELIARLEHEDQSFRRKEPKPLSEYMEKRCSVLVRTRITGKNVILVAEEDRRIVGLCWITITDRGVDKQGEIAGFYVENRFRRRGIGQELLMAARQVFINERVEVAFAWTHYENRAAVRLYEKAGFKQVTQLVLVFVPQATG
jgi:ribosomal protein S18 acetylase RimI-like enzyme